MRRLPMMLALFLVACQEKAPPPEAPVLQDRIPTERESAPEEAEAVPKTAAEATAEPATEGGGSFVVSTAALYRGPSNDRRIQVDGKNVRNYLATLYRGERVRILQQRDDYTQVVASDGTEGFVRTSAVLRESSAAATVTAETKTFKRPALVALAELKLPVGALLFVVGEKGDFSEVNYASTRTAWVLSESLARDSASYDVAKLLNRVRALAADDGKDHGEEIASLVEVARGSYPTSPILPAIVREVDPEAADRLEAQLAAASAKMTFPLHGSTPTLAWSPDGKKLLMNAAYEYYGFDKEEERDFDVMGLFVVDVETGERRRLWSKQAYHPLWLSNDQIAWGVSEYEDHENSGLFVATLDGDDTIARKIETPDENVLNTQPAKGGGVLFFADNWTDKAAWYRYDPREDRVSEVAKGDREYGAAWYPPAQYVEDQCVQAVEDVEVRVNGAVVVQSEKYQEGKELAREAPFAFEPMAGSCDTLEGKCGPILPCVAPTGKHVALIKGLEESGKLEVEVHPL